MLHKRNLHIPKLMWAVVDELVTVMEKIELDISLTEGTGLNVGVSYPSMITEEPVQDISDCHKSYLVLRHGVDGGNGNVGVATGGSPEDDTGHHLAVWNQHPIEPPRNVRRRINELEGHLAGRYLSNRRLKGGTTNRYFLVLLEGAREMVSQRRRRWGWRWRWCDGGRGSQRSTELQGHQR